MTTAACPEAARTRESVRWRLADEISAPSERELKAHLAVCGPCAAEARAADPTLLFVPLGSAFAAAPPAEAVSQVAEDVLAEVRRRTRVSAAVRGRSLFSRRFLQAAALVALGAGLFGVQGVRFLREKARLETPGLEYASLGDAAAPAAPVFGPLSGEAADLQRGESMRRQARPLIQDLKNPAARVYEFAAVSSKEPSVVFIADPHADI